MIVLLIILAIILAVILWLVISENKKTCIIGIYLSILIIGIMFSISYLCSMYKTWELFKIWEL